MVVEFRVTYSTLSSSINVETWGLPFIFRVTEETGLKQRVFLPPSLHAQATRPHSFFRSWSVLPPRFRSLLRSGSEDPPAQPLSSAVPAPLLHASTGCSRASWFPAVAQATTSLGKSLHCFVVGAQLCYKIPPRPPISLVGWISSAETVKDVFCQSSYSNKYKHSWWAGCCQPHCIYIRNFAYFSHVDYGMWFFTLCNIKPNPTNKALLPQD